MKIGILAVQGDFAAHAAMLEGLGIETVEVRTPADMEGCGGLILPGGESTTQLQFLQEEGLAETIKKFAAKDTRCLGRVQERFCWLQMWRIRSRNRLDYWT